MVTLKIQNYFAKTVTEVDQNAKKQKKLFKRQIQDAGGQLIDWKLAQGILMVTVSSEEAAKKIHDELAGDASLVIERVSSLLALRDEAAEEDKSAETGSEKTP